MEGAPFSGQGNPEQLALLRVGMEEGLTWSQISHIITLLSSEQDRGTFKELTRR